MRMFTIASLSCGIVCSGAGPLKDLWRLHGLRKSAEEMNVVSELTLEFEKHSKTSYAELPIADAVPEQKSSGPGPVLDDPLREASVALTESDMRPRTLRKPIPFLEQGIVDFILDPSALHSTASHRLLIACSILYWGGMALIPFLFGPEIKGGKNASIPSTAVLYFTIMNMASIITELWIAQHTYEGLMLIRFCGENMQKALDGQFAKASAIAAVLLSILARYDTFCDVVLTVILCKSDPIYVIKFEHTLHVEIPLPCALHHVALFSLIVGVFTVQALPGIVCLVSRRYLPAAFKLNEFNFLLGMLECEADDANADDDP